METCQFIVSQGHSSLVEQRFECLKESWSTCQVWYEQRHVSGRHMSHAPPGPSGCHKAVVGRSHLLYVSQETQRQSLSRRMETDSCFKNVIWQLRQNPPEDSDWIMHGSICIIFVIVQVQLPGSGCASDSRASKMSRSYRRWFSTSHYIHRWWLSDRRFVAVSEKKISHFIDISSPNRHFSTLRFSVQALCQTRKETTF